MRKSVREIVMCSMLALMPLSLAQAADKITVFAAASLTNAVTDVVEAFRQTHETEVVAVFAASSALARQVAQGAPADIYLSANQKWMDYLQQQGSIDVASRVTLLGNSLVLVAPADSALESVKVTSDWQLTAQLGDGRMAVGDPDHVPVGRYARQALETLGLWTAVEPRLARANSARAALALVERGETPLGIVYGTDARVSRKAREVGRFPADSHTPIEYPVAIVTGRDRPEVVELAQFLQSDTAADIFRAYGFEVR